jgi:AcrR family transcriptional regulator
VNQNQARASASQPYHHGDLRRALIAAAMELLTKEQNFNFSLREVAMRAGVSHNAPYNHFADKNDLLAAVAATGFEALRERMLAATAGIDNPETALIRSAVVYVNFGVENPSHYRLMFGSVLSTIKEDPKSSLAAAAASARGVLEEIVRRGVQAGVLDASPRSRKQQVLVLAAWSAVHGLTMLVIDGLATGAGPVISDYAEKVARALCKGLVRR